MVSTHELAPGGFAYIPAGMAWSVANGAETSRFHWWRKRWQAVPGLDKPDVIVTSDRDIAPILCRYRRKAGPRRGSWTPPTCATTCISRS